MDASGSSWTLPQQPNRPPAATPQATRGRESESGMTGTLQELAVSKATSITLPKSLLTVNHGRADDLLAFIHLHHSTAPPLPFDEPLLSLLLLWFVLGGWAICPQNPWRAFLGTELFTGADYASVVAPEKWGIHTVKLVSGAERVFDELWLPSYTTWRPGGPQQAHEHLQNLMFRFFSSLSNSSFF